MPITLPLILLEMVTSSSAQRVPTTSMVRWTSCTAAGLRMTGTGGVVATFLASLWRSQEASRGSRQREATKKMGRRSLGMLILTGRFWISSICIGRERGKHHIPVGGSIGRAPQAVRLNSLIALTIEGKYRRVWICILLKDVADNF